MKELSKYFLACKIVLDQTGTVWVQPLKVSSWLFISRQTINALDHLCIPCFPTLFCWALSLLSLWLGNRTGERRAVNSVHSYTSADHPRESFRKRSDGWICSLLGKHKVKAQRKYCLMFSKTATKNNTCWLQAAASIDKVWNSRQLSRLVLGVYVGRDILDEVSSL